MGTAALAQFQSPIGWGLSCEKCGEGVETVVNYGFNPLLVGV